MVELAVKNTQHAANLYSCVPITLNLCHSNPLGCQRPERSSNGNGDRAERAWAEPKATHRRTQSLSVSLVFLLSVLFFWLRNVKTFIFVLLGLLFFFSLSLAYIFAATLSYAPRVRGPFSSLSFCFVSHLRSHETNTPPSNPRGGALVECIVNTLRVGNHSSLQDNKFSLKSWCALPLRRDAESWHGAVFFPHYSSESWIISTCLKTRGRVRAGLWLFTCLDAGQAFVDHRKSTCTCSPVCVWLEFNVFCRYCQTAVSLCGHLQLLSAVTPSVLYSTLSSSLKVPVHGILLPLYHGKYQHIPNWLNTLQYVKEAESA